MMLEWSYLLALCVSIAALAVIDWRFKLAFWLDSTRTLKVLGLSIGIFVAWDALGIMIGIFYHGPGPYSLPLRLAPEFPLEELFFLLLLTYTALIMYRFGASQWPRT